jgi:hypothetical protein
VLGDLLRNVQPLQADEPTEILRFFVGLKGICDLQLAPNVVKLANLLPGVYVRKAHVSQIKKYYG